MGHNGYPDKEASHRKGDEESQWYNSRSFRSSQESVESLAESSESYFSTSSMVMVGGVNFGVGFSYADIVRLEACVVDAGDAFGLRGGGGAYSRYFEEEINELQDAFRKLKARALTIKEEDEGAEQRALDDEGVQGEAMRLKSRISSLLRELDEQEWSYGSDEDDSDGEGSMYELRHGTAKSPSNRTRRASALQAYDALLPGMVEDAIRVPPRLI